MAKTLKLTLADGKDHAFQTMSALKASAVQKQLGKSGDAKNVKRIQELTKKMESTGLSLAESEELNKLQDEAADTQEFTRIVSRCIRSCMPAEKNLEPSSDPAEEERRNNIFLDMVDVQDMFLIFQFVTTGTVAKREEIVLPDQEIDLTTTKK
jgi:hypothetical protein